MGYRILYFYKKENAFYRGKREGNLFFAEKELEDSVRLFICGLPEYYGRQTKWVGWRKGNRAFPVPWDYEQLLRLMQNCCAHVSADAYYLEEQFERDLAESEGGFIPDRQRMCGELIKKISGQFRGIDGILYLREESERKTEELPVSEELLRKLHYFFYMGERAKQYNVLEENLWQEYGMPLLPVRKTQELATCRIRRLLVLDDRQEGAADWEMLPRGCAYLDLWSDGERREQIMRNRADIKYVSEYLYLRQNLDT